MVNDTSTNLKLCSEDFFNNSTGFVDASKMIVADEFAPIKYPISYGFKIEPVVEDVDE